MITKEAMQAAKAAYAIEAECIYEMRDYFDDEQFAKAVELLIAAPRIGATGCGHSGIICQHLSSLPVSSALQKQSMALPALCRQEM